MTPLLEHLLLQNRRQFFGRATLGVGTAALASLLAEECHSAPARVMAPPFAAKAKRVIYLFQSGGPSQLDLYDYKPGLQKRRGQEVPRSVYPDDRKTTMSSGQTSFPVAPSIFQFKQHGTNGIWLSELLPHLSEVADELCMIRSMHTQAINHDPAITFFQTGSQVPGRPSIGSWVSYGLGSESANLPAFVAMSSRGSGRGGQPLYDRLWGSGFLSAKYQGVKFRGQGDPVLDLSDPPGVDRETRRAMLNLLARLNGTEQNGSLDPELQARLAHYEMAYRMQTSIPELVDLSREPLSVVNMYGPDVQRKGSYAYNCLLARRLAERGVRFIQLFHMGWDQHGNLPVQIRRQAKDTDQPTAALIKDLKQRGMLEDTLLIWGGEFGRTVYSQGGLKKKSYGRDHHPSCFTMWMAGAGVKGGLTYGSTDDYSVNVANDPVHVHDLHATILHLLGINHKKLTYKYQGRYFRLTDVHGEIMEDLLA